MFINIPEENREKISSLVQKVLFAKGYSWFLGQKIKYTDSPCLDLGENTIYYCLTKKEDGIEASEFLVDNLEHLPEDFYVLSYGNQEYIIDSSTIEIREDYFKLKYRNLASPKNNGLSGVFFKDHISGVRPATPEEIKIFKETWKTETEVIPSFTVLWKYGGNILSESRHLIRGEYQVKTQGGMKKSL